MQSLHVPHGVWTGFVASLTLGAVLLLRHWSQEPEQKQPPTAPTAIYLGDSSDSTGFQLLPNSPWLPDFVPYSFSDVPPPPTGLPDFPELSFDLSAYLPAVVPDLGDGIVDMPDSSLPEVILPEIQDIGDVSAPASPVDEGNGTAASSSLPSLPGAGMSNTGVSDLEAQIARGTVLGSPPVTVQVQATPEPNAGVLMMVGLLSLMACRKLRRSQGMSC